jgi:hypothetical protein
MIMNNLSINWSKIIECKLQIGLPPVVRSP